MLLNSLIYLFIYFSGGSLKLRHNLPNDYFCLHSIGDQILAS